MKQKTSRPLRPLLNSQQAAQRLFISERHLWSLTNRGIVPCIRLGTCVRYDERDLDDALQAMKREGRK